jgi:rifampicin phosphotransferase
MTVVVQRMINPTVAGVMFTANPLTGCRTEMVVDAAAGLGTAVVDGTVVADHYVLNGASHSDRGCLTGAQLEDLHRVGERLQDHFGCPQDIEWAIDDKATLWLLQSRPITTLFPLPPDTGRPPPRIYLEFGHVQGMLQPVTPMGMSALKALLASMFASFGVKVEIADIGRRLYGDLTELVRNRSTRETGGAAAALAPQQADPRADRRVLHAQGAVADRPARGRKSSPGCTRYAKRAGNCCWSAPRAGCRSVPTTSCRDRSGPES